MTSKMKFLLKCSINFQGVFKIALIGVNSRKVAWTNKWRFQAYKTFLETQISIKLR